MPRDLQEALLEDGNYLDCDKCGVKVRLKLVTRPRLILVPELGSNTMDLLIIIIPLCAVVILAAGISIGTSRGVTKGREEAKNLLLQALQARWSPTTQRVLVCLSGNSTEQEMVEELKAMSRKLNLQGAKE